MIHDQADELRHLVRLRAASGASLGMIVPLVVVAGGKGGVGATTVAVNLALALARQGRRAVFVDADLDHGGNSRLTKHPEQGSVLDVLAGRRSVHEVLQRGPLGVQVLSGAGLKARQVPAAAHPIHFRFEKPGRAPMSW
jgi:flagellar biosynthesis protein FlhG